MAPDHNPHQRSPSPAASAHPADPAAALANLRTYPFLAPLSDGTLTRLQPNLSEQRYAKGDTILRAGEYSDTAFYLKEGIVEIRMAPVAGEARTPIVKGGGRAPAPPGPASTIAAVQRSGLGADGTVILSDMPAVQAGHGTLLESGELFGEINALARYALSSDVVAHTDVVCLAIRTPALRALFKQPELAAFKEQVDNRYRKRTLGAHLRQVDLFAGVADPVIDRLRQTAELLSFEPGSTIVAQDAPADAFYLVRGGFVKVAVRTGAHDLSITYLRKGDYAGEIALLLDEPWPFSLEALEYVELVRITRDAFTNIVQGAPAVEQKLWEEVVRRLKERGRAVRNPLASQYLQMAMDTGLIHGESVMLIDMNLCTRCDDCVRACASTHGGTPRFIREGHNYRHWMVPNACYQCSDPACLVGCPTGAITRPLGTREVTINPDVCIACHNCSRRCPWNNIIEVPFESPVVKKHVDLPTKCDQCIGRSDGPACVQICPHGALTRISFKDMPQVVKTFTD
jgi:CRP-like cAMP-binding protein/Pyruvate/2-oxoacid:ferredoxin oxidoreductase delta subunit